MATIETITQRVQRRVIDRPSAVQAEIPDLVRKAHREFQERHSWDEMERREARTTTAFNPSLGTIGTDQFKEYIPEEKPFWTDDLGETYFLQISFSEADVRAAFNQNPTLDFGQPRVLLHKHSTSGISGIEWKVYPNPDGLAVTSTGEYSIQIPYYRYSPFPFESDWVTEKAEWYITFKAASEAFGLDWDLDNELKWNARAEGEFLRLRNLDKRLRTSIVETLVPYHNVFAPKLRL